MDCEHHRRTAGENYFKGTDTSAAYTMLYCTKYGETKEIISADYRSAVKEKIETTKKGKQ